MLICDSMNCKIPWIAYFPFGSLQYRPNGNYSLKWNLWNQRKNNQKPRLKWASNNYTHTNSNRYTHTHVYIYIYIYLITIVTQINKLSIMVE